MRPKAATKTAAPTAERVWTVAAKLVREKGYHAATTRELADRLEITRASLYYHVTKKEDLLHGICVEALERVTNAVREAIEGVDDPVERVRALILTHLKSMLTDIDMHATMLLDLHQLTGEQLSEVLRLRNSYESLVGSVVRDGQAAGALRPDTTDRHLTLSLLSMLNWPITWYRPGGQLRPADYARVVMDVYLDGARPR